jgi:CheY-like chemotaxis protein
LFGKAIKGAAKTLLSRGALPKDRPADCHIQSADMSSAAHCCSNPTGSPKRFTRIGILPISGWSIDAKRVLYRLIVDFFSGSIEETARNVVEDEFLVLMMIEGILVDRGFKDITTANTVAQSLALISGEKFDAAMIDVKLRDEYSYTVADALIAQGIPFFFCTGNSASDLREEYRSYPSLRKTFDDSGLTKMFDQILQ